MIILTCGLAHNLQAVDWGAWNPRKLATNLYQRFSYWYSGLLSPYAMPTPEETDKYAQARQRRLMTEAMQEEEKNRNFIEKLNRDLQIALERIFNDDDKETQWNLVKKAIEQGADINILYNNVTALYLAATEVPSNNEIVQFLLNHGANREAGNPSYHDFLNNNLQATLERILNSDDKEKQWNEVKEYIEQGADINTTYMNMTALYIAAKKAPSNNKMVQFLLNHGADKEAGNPSYNDYLKAKASLKQSKTESSEQQRKSCIQPSITISPEQQKMENNNLAAQAEWLRFNDDLTENQIDTGFYEIRKAINNGANANYVNQESDFRTPALNAAAKYMNETMVTFLLTHNANPSLTDNDGKTALQLSLENLLLHRDNSNLLNTIWNIVKDLINKGADVNTKTDNDLTALHIAVGEDNLVMINFLKIHGVNVLARDAFEESPLGIVIQSKKLDMQRQILKILYPDKLPK